MDSSEIIETLQPLPSLQEQDLLAWEWDEYVQWALEARKLKNLGQWYLGYFALGIAKKYGEDAIGKYAQEIGIPKESLQVYRWVAGKFSLEEILRAVNILPFTAYRHAAGTDSPSDWIKKAEENAWSVQRLYREIQKEKGARLPKMVQCPTCGSRIKEETLNKTLDKPKIPVIT